MKMAAEDVLLLKLETISSGERRRWRDGSGGCWCFCCSTLNRALRELLDNVVNGVAVQSRFTCGRAVGYGDGDLRS
jgi:hypothetical protein